ncbi:hypothetical protein Tco_0908855 [Tanacetum coccineum]|uniref:Uncharacterized protein n=1 Tax=Tanacetum coccineum TaxID=301880 RepID=A0ABQ5CNI0_9ASTR
MAHIMELKRRHLKMTVLTTNMSYPLRKIRRICACTSQKTTKETKSIRHFVRNSGQQRVAFLQKQSDAFEALFGDKINQVVDTNDGDQEDPDVKNKQEVKKADGQKIKIVKDEERKNVEDHQVCEGNDNTNIYDIGYIEDEPGFLAHKIDYPDDNDARDQASELEMKVLEDVNKIT